MSSWDDYRALLDEIGGLAAREAEGIATAESRYQQESRRLQNELAGAERSHRDLEVRNRQLQVGVRALTRQLGVSIPHAGDSSPLAGKPLAEAMRSAEYDLEQMRRSVAYLDARRPPVPLQSASSPSQPAPAPAPASTADEPVEKLQATNRVIIALSVVAVLIVLLALIVIL